MIVLVLFLGFSFAGAQEAKEEKTEPPKEDKPSVSIYTDILSQYMFRGVALSAESAVIQPSATLSYKGFSINVWGNWDTSEKRPPLSGHGKWNETDFTLSYSRELITGLTATVGGVYYKLENAIDDSQELFAGLSYASPWVTVGVTGWREFHNFPGWWMQIDLSRNFKLPVHDMSIDLGVSIGYLDSNPQAFADWHSGTVSAALNAPVGKYITLSPKIGLAFPLTSDASDNIKFNSLDGEETHIFGGLRIAASF